MAQPKPYSRVPTPPMPSWGQIDTPVHCLEDAMHQYVVATPHGGRAMGWVSTHCYLVEVQAGLGAIHAQAPAKPAAVYPKRFQLQNSIPVKKKKKKVHEKV